MQEPVRYPTNNNRVERRGWGQLREQTRVDIAAEVLELGISWECPLSEFLWLILSYKSCF